MKNSRGIKENKITAEKMRDILKKDYDIHSISELEKAMKESPGVDIGIFTTSIKKSD